MCYGGTRPFVGIFNLSVLPQSHAQLCLVVGRNGDMLGCELCRNLIRTVTLQSHSEYASDNGRCHFINYPLVFIPAVFQITVWRTARNVLSAFAFCLKGGLDFLADVLCIVFVDYISERKEIIIKSLIIKSKAQTGRKSAGQKHCVRMCKKIRQSCCHGSDGGFV